MALECSVVWGCQTYPWRVSCLRSLKLFVEREALHRVFSCPWDVHGVFSYHRSIQLSMDHSVVDSTFSCQWSI